MAEAFALLGPVKQALTLYYQENGNFPDQGGLPARHDALGIRRHNEYRAFADYVQQIRVKRNSGRVQVRFDNENNGVNALIARRRFELQPVVTSGVIASWSCIPVGGAARRIDEAYIKSCM